jgi:hypothetical protein
VCVVARSTCGAQAAATQHDQQLWTGDDLWEGIGILQQLQAIYVAGNDQW